MFAALSSIVNALNRRTQLAIGVVLLAAATVMVTSVIGRVAVDPVGTPAGQAAMEFLLDKLKHSKTNSDFFQSMNQ